MILALAIMFPLLAFSLWLFMRAKPIEQCRKAVHRFNIATLGVVATSCAVISVYFWQAAGQSVDRAWWPILAVLASVFSTIIILAVAALIRSILCRNWVPQ